MILEFCHVTGTSKKYALQDIHFSLEAGFIMGLAGKNGSGKTTLFDYIVNPKKQYTGEIKIEGVNIIEKTKYKALDDSGKLYVWGNYTGISQAFDGVLCLTDEQYYIAPIYSKTNGWSVIKNQF